MQISFSKWLKLDEDGGNGMEAFAGAMAPFIADNMGKQLAPKIQAAINQAVKDSAAQTAKDQQNTIKTTIQQGVKQATDQLKNTIGNKTDPKAAVEPGKAFNPPSEAKKPATTYGTVNTPNPGDKQAAAKIAAKTQQDMTRQYQGKTFGTGNPAPNAP
jgi:isocitrate dehydrogenase